MEYTNACSVSEDVRVYRVGDAAYLLSVSRRTIERLLADGEIRAVGTGKLKRVFYASIMDYIKRHK